MMATEQFDVVCIGNAIVDILAQVEEPFIGRHGLVKGAMTLIDDRRAESLYAAFPPGVECSGGSAGNTAAGVARLGGKVAYIGKVHDDQLGRVFAHDIRAAGVHFGTALAIEGPPTARCLVAVTPDAQRTMNTYLGACLSLTADDIDEKVVANADITYLEGYLWDPPAAKVAFRRAMDISHKAGKMVALTLSDSFCVERWRDEFRDLVENHVDILFANEAELLSLYQAERFDDALQKVRRQVQIAALTRSEKGSVVVSGEDIHVIDAIRIGPVLDTTGAGDLYAAGFMYGLTQGRDLGTSGRIGSVCAGAVIAQIGPRPQANLAQLVAQHVK
jgi:sugar/nucleoside kinase (ribokinase family)